MNILAWTDPKNSVRVNALLIAAYLCDKLKVKELGNNRGAWVEEFQRDAMVPPGSPWCACMVSYCLHRAGWKDFPVGKAAVRNWVSWATKRGRLTKKPERGDLFCWLNANQTGHIGFIVAANPVFITTIEGNSNAAGGREGDGCYRHVRLRTRRIQFISLK